MHRPLVSAFPLHRDRGRRELSMARPNAPSHYFLSCLQKAGTGANYSASFYGECISRQSSDEPVTPKKQIIVDQPDEEPEQ
jgi:hypothetical protein